MDDERRKREVLGSAPTTPGPAASDSLSFGKTLDVTPAPSGALAAGSGGEGTLEAAPDDRVEASELGPGAAVGHFVLRRRLGEGGMGVVFAGEDADLGRPVAIKLVRGDAEHPAYRARLLREAQAMARLEHANVVKVYEVGDAHGRLFVAMELIDGVTLTVWLREPRAWREIVDMFVQVGAGLAAVHRAGLVHRDFKPDNVLVDRHGVARVADFGLARLDREEASPMAATLTKTGVMMGTPGYMAPEQQLGGDVDGRADQYSYCVALREALGGRPIDEARWNAVPAAVRAVVGRGLSYDPAERFASLDELLAALRAGAQAGGAAPRRSRAAIVAGTVVLAAAGAAAAVIATSHHGAAVPPPAGSAIAERALASDRAPPGAGSGSASALAAPGSAEPAPGNAEPAPGSAEPAPGGSGRVAGEAPPDAGAPAPRAVAAGSGGRPRHHARAPGPSRVAVAPRDDAPARDAGAGASRSLGLPPGAGLHVVVPRTKHLPAAVVGNPAHTAVLRATIKHLGYDGMTFDHPLAELDQQLTQEVADAKGVDAGIAMVKLGMVKRREGDCKAAQELWRDCGRLLPRSGSGPGPVWEARSSVGFALCDLERGEAEDAFLVILQAWQYGNRGEVKLIIAISSYEKGDKDIAVGNFLVAEKSKDPVVQAALGTWWTGTGLSLE